MGKLSDAVNDRFMLPFFVSAILSKPSFYLVRACIVIACSIDSIVGP